MDGHDYECKDVLDVLADDYYIVRQFTFQIMLDVSSAFVLYFFGVNSLPSIGIPVNVRFLLFIQYCFSL